MLGSGFLFLNFFVKLDKSITNVIRNPFASATMQQVINQALRAANFFTKLLLSVSLSYQIRNNQTPVHYKPQKIAFALYYRFCVFKSIAKSLKFCITIAII